MLHHSTTPPLQASLTFSCQRRVQFRPAGNSKAHFRAFSLRPWSIKAMSLLDSLTGKRSVFLCQAGTLVVMISSLLL